MSNPKENKLGTAPLGRLLIELAVPTVFAQIVNLLYNMVDRIYVGRIPETGAMSLAGLGVAFPIILLVSAFASLVGMGGAPQASIAMGKKDNKTAERILGSSTLFLVILSVILSIFFMIFKHPILMMFGASENTIVYGEQYISIYLIGTIAVQIALGLNQFISCQGFAKMSMATVLIGAVLNIILDPVFIYGMNMGVRGAALATIISQFVSAIWVIWFLSSKKSIIRIKKEYLKLDKNILTSVLMLGISPFVMQSTECLVQLTFNTGMQTFGNDYYVGAMTIMFSVTQMLFLPIQGLCQGAVPIISYNYGAGNVKRVKETFRMTLISTLSFSFIGTGLILLLPKAVVGLFTTDANVLEIGAYGIRIYLFGFLIMGAQLACQQTFIALGQAKISLFLAMLRKVILVVPLAIILPRLGMGTDGLFYSEPISDLIAVTTTCVLFALNFNKILEKGQKTQKA